MVMSAEVIRFCQEEPLGFERIIMSVVVAYVPKNPSRRLPDSELLALSERLPLPQNCEKNLIKGGGVSLVFFNYGAALDFMELRTSSTNKRQFAQGEVTDQSIAWLDRLLTNSGQAANPLENPQSLISIQVREDEITLFTDCSGTQQYLYLETQDAWIFSNHQAVLGRWIESDEIDQEQLAWMSHQYHLHGFGHAFSAIRRTEPGTKYIVTPERVQIVKPNFNRKELFAPISDEDLPAMIDAVSDDIADFVFKNPAPAMLSLSGGKDSRAILGLLGPRALDEELTLWTWGEVYAPDVMAATSLTEIAGLSDKHRVGGPPLVQSTQNFSDQITKDLISDFALSSLADIRPVPVRQALQLGGHEFGLRQSATFPSRSEFFAQQKRNFGVSSLLSPLGRATLWERYEEDLLEATEECPDSKLETVVRISFRLPELISSTLTSINAAASDFHPFLDFRFLRIVLGSSPEFTERQGIHYVLNRRFPYPIECAPFAGDQWPTSLIEMAKKIGLPFRGLPQKSYRYNPAFPSQNSFGRYNWRLDLFERMRPGVLDYLASGAIDNDLLDLTAMSELVSRDSKNWTFTNFYQLGAILKMCLVTELGSSVLDARNFEMIERVVGSMLSEMKTSQAPKGVAETDPETNLKATQEALDRAQLSIRDLAKQIHDFESKEPITPDLGVIFKALKGGVVPCEFVRSALGQTLGASNLKELRRNGPESSHVFDLNFDENGKSTVSGFLLREASHRALVAIRTEGENDPIEGMAWSDAGFWYFYIAEDQRSGLFQKELFWKGHGARTVEAEVMAWYGDEPMFISLDD